MKENVSGCFFSEHSVYAKNSYGSKFKMAAAAILKIGLMAIYLGRYDVYLHEILHRN